MLTTEKLRVLQKGSKIRDPENPIEMIGVYSVEVETSSNSMSDVVRIEATFDDEGTKPTPFPSPINCYTEGTSLNLFKNENMELSVSAVGATYNVALRMYNSLAQQVGNTTLLSVTIEGMSV